MIVLCNTLLMLPAKKEEENAGPQLTVRLLQTDYWPERRMLLTPLMGATEDEMCSWAGLSPEKWPKRYLAVVCFARAWRLIRILRSYILPSQVQRKWDAFATSYALANPERRIQYIPHMARSFHRSSSLLCENDITLPSGNSQDPNDLGGAALPIPLPCHHSHDVRALSFLIQ